MLFNVSVWVNHDEYEYDPESWITGPDDDFVPSPYNTVSWCYESHERVSWDDVMNMHASWSMAPGDHDIDVTPCVP